MRVAPPTGVPGQLLALAIAAIGLACVWLAVIQPVWDWYDERAEVLRRQQALARRMGALVETLPMLRQQVAAAADSANGATPVVLLTGATDALAAAMLQQRIEAMAGQTGVRVGTQEILPGQPDAEFRAIAVRLTVTAPYPALVGLLLALARSDLPMVTDEIQIRAPIGRDANQPVEAGLTVMSWRAAQP